MLYFLVTTVHYSDVNLESFTTDNPPVDLLSDLNPPQREAAEHFEGPILVLAGAGSGKTRVLTRRVAHLVLNKGIAPQSILAVTFTNKATQEMKERLHALLGQRADELVVGTFHSIALRMLRRHANHLGYTNDFIVYDDDDSKGVLKGILKELSIDEKRFPPKLFSRVIDQAKNAFILPDTFKGSGNTEYERGLQSQVYSEYQRAIFRANAMDFGDLLVNVVRLLEKPELLALYQRHVQFVLVDEYQDTNEVQYRFIRLISAPRNNLLVVGDDDQSIYAFRGATIRNILEFERDFKDAKVVTLDQNYRSTGNILRAAHGVIEKNKGRKDKKLWTEEGEGEPVRTYVADSETEEALFIANEIGSRIKKGFTYNDVAIFYRTNAQSRAIEEALIQRKIPYRIFGGLKFYERKEIKDIIGYLRLLVSDADNQSFLRIINTPPRGVGPQTVQAVEEFAKRDSVSLFQGAAALIASAPGGRIKGVEDFIALIGELTKIARTRPLNELIEEVITRTEYAKKLETSRDPNAQSRIENLKELQSLARTMEDSSLQPFENVKAFLDRVSLTAGADAATSGSETAESVGAVSLMTLHLAKGLEFALVFLTGMEEGLIPHYRSIEDAQAIEEERRLCYVGITRARKNLFITRAERRGMFSSGQGFGVSGMFRDPSRFAYDIPRTSTLDLSADFTYGEKFVSSVNRSLESDGDEVIPRSSAGYGYTGPNRGSSSSVISRREPKETLSFEEKGAPKKITTHKPPAGAVPATKSTLISGATVHHSVFGQGTVEKLVEDSAGEAEVFVTFQNFEGSKKLVLKYAKLWVV